MLMGLVAEVPCSQNSSQGEVLSVYSPFGMNKLYPKAIHQQWTKPTMKALILNSGLGFRMGVLTSKHPKSMMEVSSSETILSLHLNQLGIKNVVMTTGLFNGVVDW